MKCTDLPFDTKVFQGRKVLSMLPVPQVQQVWYNFTWVPAESHYAQRADCDVTYKLLCKCLPSVHAYCNLRRCTDTSMHISMQKLTPLLHLP